MEEGTRSTNLWLEEQKLVLARGFERVSSEVIEGLEREVKKKDEEYRASSQKKDERYQIVLGQYEEERAKNVHLIEENENLKLRLAMASQGGLVSPDNTAGLKKSIGQDPQSLHEPTATVAIEDDQTKKFNELQKKYQETVSRLKYVERKNMLVMQKNKEMKENVLAWQKYSDRHLGKQKPKDEMVESSLGRAVNFDEGPALPSSHSNHGSWIMKPLELDKSSASAMGLLSPISHTVVNEHNQPNVQEFSNLSIPEVGISFQPIGKQTDRRGDCSRPVQSTKSVQLSTKTPSHQKKLTDRETSSQATEDELVPSNVRTMTVPAGSVQTEVYTRDAPEFVSARSLKRKRASPPKRRVCEDGISSDGTLVNPFRVKEEPLSSPPAPASPAQLFRKETQDLDELGPNTVSTPRRRRIQHTYSTLVNALQHQRSVSEPLTKEECKEEPGLAQDINARDATRTRDVNSPSLSEPSNQLWDDLRPLQPLNPNVLSARHVDDRAPPTKPLRRGSAHHLEAYNMLTESGEGPPPREENNVWATPEIARAKFNKKLRASKEVRILADTGTASPARVNFLQGRPISSAAGSLLAPSLRLSPRKAQESQREIDWMNDSSNARTAGLHTRKHGLTVADSIPLSLKPISKLKLSDFKANPRYNQGYSYAFTETVRKRGDRACLPGCTRPECCGSTFRTLASAALPLSPSAEEDLLEDYLGDAYDTLSLTQMSKEERAELVLQARTRQFANRHGRHRQAYERHTTPPGFWRVDFPTTQEHEDDRIKAVEIERKLVGERRAEALRRGGRWIFADE